MSDMEVLHEVRKKIGMGLAITGCLLIPYGIWHDYVKEWKNPIEVQRRKLVVADSLNMVEMIKTMDSLEK